MDTHEKGLVIIYTGEGKGKTTAALGLILRAAGYKRKCLIIQFGKKWFSGEVEGVKNYQVLSLSKEEKDLLKFWGISCRLKNTKKQQGKHLLYYIRKL